MFQNGERSCPRFEAAAKWSRQQAMAMISGMEFFES
jgi:hypothetical protein